MQLSMSQASLFGGTPAYLYFQVHIYVWYGCLMYLFISAIVNHVGFTSFVTVTDIGNRWLNARHISWIYLICYRYRHQTHLYLIVLQRWIYLICYRYRHRNNTWVLCNYVGFTSFVTVTDISKPIIY